VLLPKLGAAERIVERRWRRQRRQHQRQWRADLVVAGVAVLETHRPHLAQISARSTAMAVLVVRFAGSELAGRLLKKLPSARMSASERSGGGTAGPITPRSR